MSSVLSGDARTARPLASGTQGSARVAPGLRLLAGALSGLVAYGAFPPLGAWPLAIAATALLVLAVRGAGLRLAALVGGAHGLALFLPLVEWTAANAGLGALVGLAVLQALFYAAYGPLAALAGRAAGWPLWCAGLWVLQEAARARLPFGGFPWGRLAFSQADSPLLPLAALGGAPLLSFAVALYGTLLAWALQWAFRRARTPRTGRDARPATARTTAGARVAATAGAGTAATAPTVPTAPTVSTVSTASTGVPAAAAAAGVALAALAALVPVPTDGQAVPVAVVQGNVPRLGLGFNAQRAAVLDNHVETTRQLAADVDAGRRPRPELVIWPENASDIDPFTDDAARAAIDGAVQAIGVPVLVGTLVDRGEKVENTGVVWDPVTGPGQRYVKRHPVPFGEYIPFRSLARRITSRVDLVPRDFVAGERPGVLSVGPVVVGDVICFEVAYDDLVRDVVRGGGKVLVVQTNNATFGRSAETEQQLAMGRLRAVEHGRSVLVAATSGISAVLAPDGSVVSRVPVFERGVLSAEVPTRSGSTLATRAGCWPEAALVLVGLVGLVVGARRRAVA